VPLSAQRLGVRHGKEQLAIAQMRDAGRSVAVFGGQ